MTYFKLQHVGYSVNAAEERGHGRGRDAGDAALSVSAWRWHTGCRI
ncbi:MAG: hypothetical protein LBH60_03065 [Prevotellaceae bacterium]|nr:hypothetical protein [Prevotellaceae bacterium]